MPPRIHTKSILGEPFTQLTHILLNLHLFYGFGLEELSLLNGP